MGIPFSQGVNLASDESPRWPVQWRYSHIAVDTSPSTRRTESPGNPLFVAAIDRSISSASTFVPGDCAVAVQRRMRLSSDLVFLPP